MEIRNRFYVVEFLDPPYRGFDQYVCIPESWVQMHDESTNIVVTRYPVEKSLKTEQRIKQGDITSIDWSFYTAYFKYCISSYEEAKQYIERLENRVVVERNYPVLTKEDDDGNVFSGTRMAESQITSFNDMVEPASEFTPVTNSEIETHKKQAREVKFANSTNELTNQTPTSSKSMNDKQLPSTSKRSLDQVITTRKIYDEKSNNVDRSEINDNSRDVTGNESFVNDNTPKLTNESLDSTIMKEINPTMLSAQSTPINNYSTVTTSNTNATEVEEEEREKERQVAKKTQVETGELKRKEFPIEERGGDDDDNQDISKKKRREPRNFILPPEYDPNDPKWTLRYRQPSEGLVELKKDSGIYVNAVNIYNCERDASDWKTLARWLISEIFTERALETCVLECPYKSNALCIDDKDTQRPLFYENAKTVLYNYVENYARSRSEEVKREDIKKYIRKRIQRIREDMENTSKQE